MAEAGVQVQNRAIASRVIVGVAGVLAIGAQGVLILLGALLDSQQALDWPFSFSPATIEIPLEMFSEAAGAVCAVALVIRCRGVLRWVGALGLLACGGVLLLDVAILFDMRALLDLAVPSIWNAMRLDGMGLVPLVGLVWALWRRTRGKNTANVAHA